MADKRISQLIERVDIANNDVLPIVASGATTTNKVTISTIQDWMQSNLDVGVTSVGLTMPSAFQVSGSPITTSGNITVTATGTASQYIRGDGTLADFPQGGGGGGASVSYYLNGSVSQGTIGGVAYLEMNKTPILGAGTDFNISADGYIASFITDAGDPALLEIPAGNWNFETYFQASSAGGTPSFYVELYKVSGATATLIASNSGNPELIAFGTSTTPYFSALAVPQTTLALTDRLAIRIYVVVSGRTITLHTENSNLCQVITTFTTGLTALNGLTAQVQNFATGTSGTDFNISSTGSIHTFNLPDASASNRGAVTTGSQVFGGVKTFANGLSLSAVGGSNQVTRLVNIGTLHEGSATLNQIGFNSGNNIYFGKGLNNGGVISWNNAAVRYYTLPDADGTIALTSQIPANPVGGTGTTNQIPKFSGTSTLTNSNILDNGTDVVIGSRTSVSLSSQTILLTPNSGTMNRIETTGTLGLAIITSGSSITLAAGGTTPQITLASTGAVTLTGALNGTNATFTAAGSTFVSTITTGGSDMRISSGATEGNVGTFSNHPLSFVVNNSVVATIAVGGAATFSSSVSAGQLFLSTPSNLVATINSTNPSGCLLTWQTNGTIIGDIGTAEMLFGTGGADTFGISGRGARSLILGTNNTARLTITSSGATTLSGALNGTSATLSSNFYVSGGTNTNTGNGVHLFNESNFAQVQLNGATGSLIDFSTSGTDFLGRIIYTNSTNAMQFHTNSAGTAALTLSSTGAANFSNSLRIQGSTVPASGSGTELSWDGTNGYLLAFNRSTSTYLPLSIQGSSLSFTGAATFSSSVTANRLSLNNSGTAARLQINGVNSEPIAYLYNNSGTAGSVPGVAIEAGTNSSDYALSVASSLGTSYFRVRGDGNVGIGTASPDTKLQVAGTGSTGFSVRANTSGDAFMRLYRDSTITSHWYDDRTNNKVTIGSVESIPFTFDTGGTERMRITSDGYARLSASSGGIQFNGDTAAANALDDYEEGTWTPAFIGGGGGSATYNSRRGWYTKIGRQVTIVWEVSFQKGTISSTLQMSGLPFVVLSDSGSFYPQGAVLLDNLSTTTNNITFQVANGSTSGDFIGGNGGTTSHTGLLASALGSGTMMCRGSATYFV